MPYLKLTTNIAVVAEQNLQLLGEFSQLLAKQTSKPEMYVMVEIDADKPMLFGSSNAPLAYVECKSIGLSLAQTKPLAHAICQILKQSLKISPERVYIEFSDCRAEYWGWNGSTFA